MSLMGGFGNAASGMRDRHGLASVLYRSKATVDFSDQRIDSLVSTARARNHKRDVTGALYFEEGCFMQWLEGPAATIVRLFGQIGLDQRHTDVEVLSFGQTPQRVFGDWNLRLFHGFTDLPVIDPLVTDTTGLNLAHDPDVLRHMAHALARGQVGEFAIALKQTGSDFPAQAGLCEQLMQCYAELWANDDCTEMDTVLGLSLAQTQFRLHRTRFPVYTLPRAGETVLVIPAPGEKHGLGASLAQAALEEAGYTVPVTLPNSLEGIDRLFKQCFCNHVVIASSGVFGREHRVGAIRDHADTLRRWLPDSARVFLYGQLAQAGRAVIGEAGCDRGTHRVAGLTGLIEPLRGKVH